MRSDTNMSSRTYKIAINSQVSGKIPPNDPRWREFNDSFENRELTLMELANEIYTGHAYTTWHEGRRAKRNFVLGQHLAIDMDTETAESDPATLIASEFIQMYGAIVHTTPSHKPEAPRSRVLFMLDEPIETAIGYEQATNVVLDLYRADQSCRDACRFFYGASGCELRTAPNILPVAHLRRLHRLMTAKSTESPARPQNRSGGPYVSSGDDLEKVSQALAVIDPNSIDYPTWIGYFAAMKRDLGDTARQLAINWGAGTPGEVEREWERIKVDHDNPMTIGSIIYEAGRRVPA